MAHGLRSNIRPYHIMAHLNISLSSYTLLFYATQSLLLMFFICIIILIPTSLVLIKERKKMKKNMENMEKKEREGIEMNNYFSYLWIRTEFNMLNMEC